jgi:hypothetical protein
VPQVVAHEKVLANSDEEFNEFVERMSGVSRPWELKRPLDLITSDFVYVRWLGNRTQIETMTTVWDKTIVGPLG